MASRDYNSKTGKARLFFRYGGRQFSRMISVKSGREAGRACALIEETIQDLERGKIVMPQGADPAVFLVSGGKLAETPQLATTPSQEAAKLPGLKFILDTYAATLTPGSKEANSLGTEAVHRRHFLRILDENLVFDSLGVDAIRGYVDARAKEGVRRETIRKGLSTLRVIGGWAFKRKLVASALGWKMNDPTFPKAGEKPPFQTWDQITRKIGRGGMTEAQQAELWENLWLDQDQTLECLSRVRENATHPFRLPYVRLRRVHGRH